MTQSGSSQVVPFQVRNTMRWKVCGIYLTLSPTADGKAVRIYAKGRNDLGKCGVVMKVRRHAADAPTSLSVKMINEALTLVVRRHLADVVHLDERADGTIRISLAPQESCADEIYDPSSGLTLLAALDAVRARAANNTGPLNDHHRERLRQYQSSH